jgi:5-methylcytosine-specific restriction protein A
MVVSPNPISQRYLSSSDTQFTGGCRWCGGEISPPRRTFCGAACVHEHKLRTSGSYLRDCVFRRDNAICAICEFDTKPLAKKLRGMTRRVGRKRIIVEETRPEYELICAEYGISVKRKAWGTGRGGGLWDADHIVRVVDGGGCTGLANLRTLCCSCHKAVTWAARIPAKLDGIRNKIIE